MKTSMKVRAALVAGLLLGCVNVASAGTTEPSAADIDQMTDVVLTMMPMGAIMEMAATNDPSWPLQGAADKVSKEQLACMRGHLNSEGVWRMKRAEVNEYAQANAVRFAADLDLARKAAPLFAGFAQAAIDAKQNGEKTDAADRMKAATADQMIAMVSIMSDSKYAGLRELSGYDGGATNNVGEGVKFTTIKLMLTAMQTCDIPMSLLFE